MSTVNKPVVYTILVALLTTAAISMYCVVYAPYSGLAHSALAVVVFCTWATVAENDCSELSPIWWTIAGSAAVIFLTVLTFVAWRWALELDGFQFYIARIIAIAIQVVAKFAWLFFTVGVCMETEKFFGPVANRRCC